MSLVTPKTWLDEEHPFALDLNRNFAAVQGKFSQSRGGISDEDVSSGAAIQASKINFVSDVKFISQSGLNSNATPSFNLVNIGDGGIIKIANTGSGFDLFLDTPTLNIDLDNDNDESGEVFKITKNNQAQTLFQADTDLKRTLSFQTFIITIGNTAFKPNKEIGSDAGAFPPTYDFATDGEYVDAFEGFDAGTHQMFAPVRLPDDARIVELSFRGRKGALFNDRILELRKSSLTGTSSIIATVGNLRFETGGVDVILTKSFTDGEIEAIDLQNSAYWLKYGDLFGTDRFYHAKIKYKCPRLPMETLD